MPPKTCVWTWVSGAVLKLRYSLSMFARWTRPMTAVTGSCQTSVTPASTMSSSPEMIRTDEMSRMKRRIGRPPIRRCATAGALSTLLIAGSSAWWRRANPGRRR